MEMTRLAIDDVIRLVPRRSGDDRGYFSETWNHRRLQEAGIDITFVQDNQSYSAKAGTVRGLHYQAPPHAQAKLVRVLCGATLDVAVDIRRSSPTYGKWVGAEISAEDGAQLLVPRGFLHGFVTLVDDTVVAYKVDSYYAADCAEAVRFDDQSLAIDWGIDPKDAVLSGKDANAPAFAGFETPFD